MFAYTDSIMGAENKTPMIFQITQKQHVKPNAKMD
jgi:hypothetical protein